MHPVDGLRRHGGIASYRALVALSTRAQIRGSLAAGDIRRDGRGSYSLPSSDEALRVAHATRGVVSHLSAALHWGWEVKTVPERPHLTVPRGRRSTPLLRGCVLHRTSLDEYDVDGLVTSRERTLVDCLRFLPEDEGLCVADSALRHGAIGSDQLVALAGCLSGPGAGRARRVAERADGRAANPFESVLRHQCLAIRGLRPIPQLSIVGPDFVVRPDLVDPLLGIVVEAESQTWHNSTRQQLRRDCRRYTALVVRGWLVARFAWEDVMFQPDYVLEELTCLVAAAHRLPKDRLVARPAA